MTVTRLWADGQFVSVSGAGYSPDGNFEVDGTPVDVREYPAILSTLWLGVLNNDSEIEITGKRVHSKPIALLATRQKARCLLRHPKQEPFRWMYLLPTRARTKFHLTLNVNA